MLQGEAHASLEQYEAAREAYLEALSLDMGDAAAAVGLAAAVTALAADEDIGGGGGGGGGGSGPSPHSPVSPAAVQKRWGSLVSVQRWGSGGVQVRRGCVA